MNVRKFVLRLERVRRVKGGWQGRCPSHPDKNPSLSVSESPDGRILLKCFAGCETPAILAALGLQMSDLFPDSKAAGSDAGRRIAATYDYLDETGKLLFQVVRFEPKDFRQRKTDGKNGWIWNLNGTRRVLFNLPAVLKARSVLVCEGEKDCLTAEQMGLTATCNPGGAGKWRPEYSESLRGKSVAVVCDADAPGLAHGREVARSLVSVAASVKLVKGLPGNDIKDLTDYVDIGGTRESLLNVIREAPAVTAADVARSVSQKANGFILTTLGELLKRPDMPIDYIWDGRLVTGTVSAVVSKPKVGKSTLARNLCLAASRGEEFLGFRTKQGECIYLALEEREEDVRNDFRAMGANGTEPILIHAAAAPAEGIRELCELVRGRTPRLIVIDPLFRLAHVKDDKAYAEVYSALGPLIDAARDSGAHIMLVHHSGKGSKADPVDSPLGSTAIGGVASTLIVLKRTDAYRVIQTVQRIGQEMPETVLQFDSERKRLSIGETRAHAETESLGEEILDFLRAAGEEYRTEPEITGAVEGKTKFVRRALRQLVEQGRVSREGAGRRGDAYRYHLSFSCSQHIPGTREQETQTEAQTGINTARNLVPTPEPKPILVPEMEEGEI